MHKQETRRNLIGEGKQNETEKTNYIWEAWTMQRNEKEKNWRALTLKMILKALELTSSNNYKSKLLNYPSAWRLKKKQEETVAEHDKMSDLIEKNNKTAEM